MRNLSVAQPEPHRPVTTWIKDRLNRRHHSALLKSLVDEPEGPAIFGNCANNVFGEADS
jgi:hypothetical protein